MVRCSQLVLAVLEEALQALNTFVACNQLSFRDGHLLLQSAVLLDELTLHHSQLFQVSFQESHLLLLGAIVGRS